MPNQTFKRRVAKFVARNAVWTGTTALVQSAADQILDIEDDTVEETAVELGALTIGFAVMIKCEKYTDQMVDRVADWRIARKAAKAEHPESE